MQRTNNTSVSEATATTPRLNSFLLLLALLSGLTASAQTSTVTTNFTDGRVIPDASASGLASTRMVSTRITQMTDLNVTLKVNGSFNGDLYAYLMHSSGRTVLLNRVGKRASNNLGYGDDGLNVTFDDGATNGDVHVYRYTINGGNHNPALPANTPLTGAWAPDGRTNSPLTVLDTDTRAALLNSFNGLNPNGEWVLFVADLESGDIHTLDNWGLEITGYTPPLITANPASLTKECSLENATFSVTANGSAPLSYQWRYGGSSITDATNSTLTIPNVTYADNGNYDVVVSSLYGSVTSSMATLTVQDTTAPVAPTLATVTGECSATVTAPSALDNCAGSVTGTTVDPLTYNSQGTFTVHWTFNDGHGNSSTANQTVIVHDVTAPVAPTLATVTGECSATVTAPTATDNCVGSVTGTTVDPLTYNTQGTFTVHWSFTDGHGNTSTANQTVIVHDVTAPIAPTIADAAGECSVTVTAPTATDNCAGSITGTTVDPLTYNTQGTFTVHWTFNDGHGNSSTANQTVIVHDVTAPVAPTIASATGECSVTVTAPTATDNCAGSVTGTTVDPLTYNSQGTFTVHWTFNDGHGNSSTANQTVIVHDVTAPVAPTLATVTGECSATVTAPTATDNCMGNIVGTTTDPLSYNTQGTFTVHWSFTDGNGNTTTANQTVIVHDVTAPVAPTLANVTGECSATVTAPSALDNCAGSVTGTTVDPLTYNTQGTFTVHWTFNDGHGNSSTANQTVIVHDVTAPTVTCPANISVFTTNGSGTTVSFALPSGSDNCGVASVVASPASGSNFPIGTTPVVITVTDVGGNSSQCSFNVTVVLNTAPVAGNDNMGVVQNQARSVKIEKCLSNDSDLDNDAMTVIAVSNGAHGTATFNSTHITYTPATDYVGSDAFTYTISDGRGGVATATITVQVYSAEAATPNMLPIVMNGSIPTVRFAGIPGFTYTLERTQNLSPAAWQAIGGTITVPANGIAEYPDTTAPVGSAFYRTVSAALP